MRGEDGQIPEELALESEAAFYRALAPEERARLLAEACRAAATLLLAHAHPDRATDYVDPLPESTLRALARLRATSRHARGRVGGG